MTTGSKLWMHEGTGSFCERGMVAPKTGMQAGLAQEISGVLTVKIAVAACCQLAGLSLRKRH